MCGECAALSFKSGEFLCAMLSVQEGLASMALKSLRDLQFEWDWTNVVDEASENIWSICKQS